MKKILVPVDGSNQSRRALDIACDLAARHDAQVLLFHTMLRDKDAQELKALANYEAIDERSLRELDKVAAGPLPEVTSAGALMQNPDAPRRPAPAWVLESIGQTVLDHAQQHAEELGAQTVRLPIDDGPAAERILDCAKREAADTIVMGSRGLRSIESLTFGSVSEKVSRDADCTCVIVK
jgi:nucleotide-binding universal stress UspA family protein